MGPEVCDCVRCRGARYDAAAQQAQRPVRLTPAEWSAIVGAVARADADGADVDTPESRREYAARDRALGKIRDALTTPAVRGDLT